MREAAADLEFEDAARIRDEIKRLEASDLGIPNTPENRLERARASLQRPAARPPATRPPATRPKGRGGRRRRR